MKATINLTIELELSEKPESMTIEEAKWRLRQKLDNTLLKRQWTEVLGNDYHQILGLNYSAIQKIQVIDSTEPELINEILLT